MRRQTTDEVLMIRPVKFEYNPETASDNRFQVEGDKEEAHIKAVREFDNFTVLLRNAGINVNIIEDTPVPHTPDSIFPNNWFTTHCDGELVFYPLHARNRRLERKEAPVKFLRERYHLFYDFTYFEAENKFLEGTGSMVFDRVNRIAYVCRAERSNPEVFDFFCRTADFKGVFFNSYDGNGIPIYHTNVMMSVCSRFAFIALCAIRDESERRMVRDTLVSSGKEIIELSMKQVENFAGNVLELKNKDGESVLVLSESAYNILNESQKETIHSSFDRLVIPSIPTIEKNGGGSARCMIAELF